MVLRSWRPVNPLAQLRREMDRLVSGWVPDGLEWPWTGMLRSQPAVNVWETPESIYVELEVPGLKSDQLDVSVVGDQLSIKIERPEPTEQNVTYHRRERAVGSFLRVVQLPAEVDANRVAAELQHGVLTIELPKAEAAKPRKIQVTSTP